MSLAGRQHRLVRAARIAARLARLDVHDHRRAARAPALVAIAVGVFMLFMHWSPIGWSGRYANAAIDKQTLVTITASVLLSWLLMISQAMESITRAFYARSDLDLILASPVASNGYSACASPRLRWDR